MPNHSCLFLWPPHQILGLSTANQTRRLTIRWPSILSTTNRRHILEDLKPDRALAIPRGGSLTAGDLCHVRGQRARVVDVRRHLPGYLAASVNRGDVGCAAGGPFVASDRIACHVRHRPVALEVGRLFGNNDVRNGHRRRMWSVS